MLTPNSLTDHEIPVDELVRLADNIVSLCGAMVTDLQRYQLANTTTRNLLSLKDTYQNHPRLYVETTFSIVSESDIERAMVTHSITWLLDIGFWSRNRTITMPVNYGGYEPDEAKGLVSLLVSTFPTREATHEMNQLYSYRRNRNRISLNNPVSFGELMHSSQDGVDRAIVVMSGKELGKRSSGFIVLPETRCPTTPLQRFITLLHTPLYRASDTAYDHYDTDYHLPNTL